HCRDFYLCGSIQAVPLCFHCGGSGALSERVDPTSEREEIALVDISDVIAEEPSLISLRRAKHFEGFRHSEDGDVRSLAKGSNLRDSTHLRLVPGCDQSDLRWIHEIGRIKAVRGSDGPDIRQK